MPADRLTFYQQRKQKILQQKFQAINTTDIDWKNLAKRQSSFREELILLDQLIIISRQSVYQSSRRILYPRGPQGNR
jgi:hypothetical protein